VCNAFHLGAYQVAINEASELNDTELSATERVEKDCYAYRSYVALGSYQVRIVVYVVALFFFSLFFSLSLFYDGALCFLFFVARRCGEKTTTTTTKKKKKKKKKRAI
jgi:hypothetical protein